MVNRNIDDLQPVMARGCREFVRRCEEQGLKVLITETYRTIERQNELFNQRPKVTTVAGGDSIHNYGLAFDFCQNIKGREWELPFFEKAGAIWREMGGVWGGDWTSFVDRPHCEFTSGLSTAYFKYGAKLSDATKMRWES